MKKLLLLATVASLIAGATAQAAPGDTAISGSAAGSTSTSGSSADNNSTLNANAAGGAGGAAKAVTGDSTAAATNGAQTTAITQVTNNRPTPAVVLPGTPAVVSPQFFIPPNPQAGSVGAPLEFNAIEQCQRRKPIDSIDTIIVDGASGKTKITWNSFFRSVNANHPANKLGARFEFGNVVVDGICAGTITIAAKPEFADVVDMATVMGDEQKFVINHLQSDTGFVIAQQSEAVSMASVMDSKAAGIGGAGSLAGLAGPAYNALAGALSGTLSSGSTAMHSRIGQTVLVMIPSGTYTAPAPESVDLGKLGRFYPPTNQVPVNAVTPVVSSPTSVEQSSAAAR